MATEVRNSGVADISPLLVWGSMLVLAAVAIFVRLPFLGEPPGRDQALFLTQSGLLLEGMGLYSEVWEHKPPGIIFLYGLASFLFGSGYASIQILHGLAGFVTAVGLFWIGQRSGLHGSIAMGMGVFYLLFFGGPLFGGFWATAQVEIFVDPLVVLSLLCIVPAGPGQVASRMRWFTGGVAVGIAVMWLKYSCAPLAGLGLLVLIYGESTSSRVQVFHKGLAWLGGILLPAFLLLLYFGVTGRFQDFWSATVAFNLVHREISTVDFPGSVWTRVIPWLGPLLVLYVLSALALFARVFWGRFPRRRDALLVAGLLLWLCCLAEVFIQDKFWIYHYHVILLPLVLLSALGTQALLDALVPKIGRSMAWAVLLIIVGVLTSPYGYAVAEYLRTHQVIDFREGRIARHEYLDTYRWGDGDYNAAENEKAAARVASETRPEDSVFVWGFEPSIYGLAARLPASRFLYDYPLLPRLGSLAELHQGWLMADLERNSPVLFLVVERDANDLEPIASSAQLRQNPALSAYLEQHYRAAWKEGDFTAYRRVE